MRLACLKLEANDHDVKYLILFTYLFSCFSELLLFASQCVCVFLKVINGCRVFSPPVFHIHENLEHSFDLLTYAEYISNVSRINSFSFYSRPIILRFLFQQHTTFYLYIYTSIPFLVRFHTWTHCVSCVADIFAFHLTITLIL